MEATRFCTKRDLLSLPTALGYIWARLCRLYALSSGLWFLYLFVLPSTISSSVAMTVIGKGNLPGAIFNASLSSILGVFITPLLIQLFMGLEGAELNLMESVISISKMLLLPMLVGQLMRPLLF